MDLDKQQRRAKRKKILLTCLGVSLSIHVAALFVFYKNPPSYLATMKSLLLRSVTSDESFIVAEETLEEVFDHFETTHLKTLTSAQELHTFISQVTPLQEENQLVTSPDSSNLETQDPTCSLATFSSPILPLEEPLISPSHKLSTVSLASSKKNETPSFPIETAKEPFQQEMQERLKSSAEESADLFISSQDQIETGQEISINFPPLSPQAKTPPLMAFKSFQEPIFHSKELLAPHLGAKELSEYDLPDVFSTIDWDGHFDIQTEVIQNPEGEGYLFSVTLEPIHDLTDKKMKQNFTFLIDRSNSIDKHYYEAFKKAVYRALTYLPEGNTFNIVVLDRKITHMSPKPLPITKSTIYAAKQFLAKQEKSHLFSATEIYPMLEKALPTDCADHEMNVAFIFTDGNTLLNSKKQKKALQKIIEKNHGKLTLHTAAAGMSNNVVLLDLLSGCNRGSLFYTRTYASFPRKFVSSLLRLKNPLLKDISVSSLSEDPLKKVEIYPSAYATPCLYQHEPYVILGKTNTLDTIHLILEGRNGDQWISIQKEINLNKAKKGQSQLAKKWEKQKARTSYESFLKTGNATFLKEARISLQTCSDYPIP